MQPVVILGAGINGAAVARDLCLNGVPVVLIDSGDIAQGATSRSSRLIHGGLRYLEYRDLALVRESLAERERLLRLAPQFVTPLRLSIPVRRLTGGLTAAAIRFLGLSENRCGKWLLQRFRSPRGLLAVRTGLFLYDLLSGSSSLPRHSVIRSGDAPCRRACVYWDAQLAFPERFVLSLLHDARQAARSHGTRFEIHPHHTAQLDQGRIRMTASPSGASRGRSDERPTDLQPAFIVNATGAWGDLTLRSLGADEGQLFAGTRGSHLFTAHEPLRSEVRDGGIYAEADDGRMVFILPLGQGVLIGTTDLPHLGSPGDAVATEIEVEYLLDLVNNLLPQAGLRREHVEVCHAGVRPLPRTSRLATGAIPRGHSVHWSMIDDIPVATLIGGKLTTCRQLAEEVTDALLAKLSLPRSQSTLDRPLPGHAPVSADRPEDSTRTSSGKQPNHAELTPEQCAVITRLAGHRVEEIAQSVEFHAGRDSHRSVIGTTIPRGFVRWSLRQEWVGTLNDLVERRLMLIFEPQLTRDTLDELADLMIEAECLPPSARNQEVRNCIDLLQRFQGKRVLPAGD